MYRLAVMTCWYTAHLTQRLYSRERTAEMVHEAVFARPGLARTM